MTAPSRTPARTPARTVPVALAGRSYDVVIEPGCVIEGFARHAGPFLPRGAGRKAAFVADANTHRLFAARIEARCAEEGIEPDWFVVEPGEGAKSWAVLETLCDRLLALGLTRSDHVVALGGGVVGDLTGFAAAVLKRGCGFVQVPTTLLAQVDSSVGGKTAINTGAGKNLIGAFHQPSLVLIDPLVLDSLPDREMRAGYAEVLKYGLLGDAAFFDWLEANGTAVLAREPEPLAHAIATSVAAKARIVAEDERETSGRRALLNLGHTFGHALEAETGFSDRLLHGEAVALGMVLAGRYSARRGELAHEEAERAARAIGAAGLPSEIAALGLECDGERLVDHMRHDKKMEGSGTLPFLLLRGIGKAFMARDVELADVAAFLDEQLQAH
ncbi:3-dehydroquinate synthase [Erythrobacter sp. HL-111]|uniref:3-dehydroquinate synthase n=1 Tax=Erythrobacter sp. HL-111 TaxID=1798193 RepID=UPI0006D98D40|nr:3-dehydroquinate synthase [Erythrobacter sp. HL-111]KPP90305.1 MAG: 3-dehydroquinate synthase AroB [Erythrobacteraceae bacterium HL-111]SDR83743.1 3-dehydroquinate synthase [Erythrobacter sp. HL-111]